MSKLHAKFHQNWWFTFRDVTEHNTEGHSFTIIRIINFSINYQKRGICLRCYYSRIIYPDSASMETNLRRSRICKLWWKVCIKGVKKLDRYWGSYSVEYSAKISWIFGIGRYQFYPYRSKIINEGNEMKDLFWVFKWLFSLANYRIWQKRHSFCNFNGVTSSMIF